MLRFSLAILIPALLCACTVGPVRINNPEARLSAQESAIMRHKIDSCEHRMLGPVDGQSTVSQAAAYKIVLEKAALIGASGIVVHGERVVPEGQFTYYVDASAYRCVG